MRRPVSSRRSIRALLAFVTALAGGEAARADADRWSAWSLSGSIKVLTDYVDRGVSQSDGHSAVQGEVLWQHSGGVYAALWGSTVDFDDGRQATAEVNYILGLERELGTSQLGASVAYIHYPGAAAELEYDLIEFSASVEHPAGPLELSGQAIFTPQSSGRAGKAAYVALGASKQLGEAVSVGVHMGRQWHEREEIAGPDYHDWEVALEWSRERFNAALRFSDTDRDRECVDICNPRFAAAVGISF